MYACHVHAVPMETRRGNPIPWLPVALGCLTWVLGTDTSLNAQGLPVSGTAVVTVHSQGTTFLCLPPPLLCLLETSSPCFPSFTQSLCKHAGGRQNKSRSKSLRVEFYLGMGGRERYRETETDGGGGREREAEGERRG